MKLEKIMVPMQKIIEDGGKIENNIIKEVNVNIVGHYGNACCLDIRCEDVMACSGYNNTQTLGYLLRALVELLEVGDEDGRFLKHMRNIPVRLIFNKNGRCIGFGHFMKDRFVYTNDFVRITE